MAKSEGEAKRRFKIFSGMTWPILDNDLAWRLLHAPQGVTREDQLYLSSVLTAYSALIHTGRANREMICRELRTTSPSERETR